MGVSKNEFMHSTPKVLKAYDKAYLIRLEERDRENWQLGQYIKSAICSSFSKEVEYVKQPFLSDIHLTEEEKEEKALQEFIAGVERMQNKFKDFRKD